MICNGPRTARKQSVGFWYRLSRLQSVSGWIIPQFKAVYHLPSAQIRSHLSLPAPPMGGALATPKRGWSFCAREIREICVHFSPRNRTSGCKCNFSITVLFGCNSKVSPLHVTNHREENKKGKAAEKWRKEMVAIWQHIR